MTATETIEFTGKERDTETGLDYFLARYYSGAQGRFTSPDPDNAGSYADDPQSWNGYAYGRNNPLKFVDPDGLAYRVCQVGEDGKEFNCGTVNDDRAFENYAKGQGWSLKSGKLLDQSGNVVGAAHYFNPEPMEALIAGTQRADVLIKDAAKQMAVGAVVGGVGGAVLGRFAPQLIDLAAARLPVTRVFPALSRLSPKILRQMQTRGWTRAEIQEAFESGQQVPAVNRLRGGTPATRYVHPTTGKAVTIDNATGEVIQVGGSGFTYTHY